MQALKSTTITTTAINDNENHNRKKAVTNQKKTLTSATP